MNMSNTVPYDANIPINASAVQAGIQGLCLQPKTVTLKTEEVDFQSYNPEVTLLDRRSDAAGFHAGPSWTRIMPGQVGLGSCRTRAKLDSDPALIRRRRRRSASAAAGAAAAPQASL